MEDQSGIATLIIRSQSLKNRQQVEPAPELGTSAVEEEEPSPAPVIVDPAADETAEVAQEWTSPESEAEHPAERVEEPLQQELGFAESDAEEIHPVIAEHPDGHLRQAFVESEAGRSTDEAEEPLQSDLTVVGKAATEIHRGLLEHPDENLRPASLVSEAEQPVEEVEDELPPEPVVPEQIDGAVPTGVPPKLNISVEILDFGTVGKPENSQRFSISNSGGAILNVSIQAEEWIDRQLEVVSQ